MSEYISFDSHKSYTLVGTEDVVTGKRGHRRLEHRRGVIRDYLEDREAGTEVAVEATGNWYWIIEEIEEAGLLPRLVHPRKAKLMMGLINKTDKLDVDGLNQLQRTGTLPTVWIPPGPLRDVRELTRTRMVMVRQSTRLKNRIQSTLSKYGLSLEGFSDFFGVKARQEMDKLIEQLPEHAAYVSRSLLAQLAFVQEQITALNKRLKKVLEVSPEMQLLTSIPGIGLILAAVIALEVGDVSRFSSAEHLASYSGTTPRVHSSGQKTRYGRLRQDVNRYLKWAFMEAANTICMHHRRRPERHVSRLYKRIQQRKGHAKAIGAVARHLAEATFHVLSKEQPYLDPVLRAALTRGV